MQLVELLEQYIYFIVFLLKETTQIACSPKSPAETWKKNAGNSQGYINRCILLCWSCYLDARLWAKKAWDHFPLKICVDLRNKIGLEKYFQGLIWSRLLRTHFILKLHPRNSRNDLPLFKINLPLVYRLSPQRHIGYIHGLFSRSWPCKIWFSGIWNRWAKIIFSRHA